MNNFVRSIFLILCSFFCTGLCSKPLAIGSKSNFVISEKGSVIAWSFGDYLKPKYTVMEIPSTIISIACGKEHLIALDENGKVWFWDRRKFVSVPLTEKPFKAIALEDHGIFLDEEGNVWRYGKDLFKLERSTNEPKLMAHFSTIIAVDSGYNHNIALDEDGHLWTWGYGDKGQLGHGNLEQKSSPTQINSEEHFIRIAAGATHNLAIDIMGRVWFFGCMICDKDPDLAHIETSPIIINFEAPVTNVAAGIGYSIALDVNGDVWTWGDGEKGKLGHGWDDQYKRHPTKVEKFSPHPIVDFVASENHSLFVDSAGIVWICGNRDLFDWPQSSFRRYEMPQAVKLPGCLKVKSARK